MPEPLPPDAQISARWADALLIARLLAVGGSSLGGVRLQSGAGPVRDRWLEVVQQMAGRRVPWIRIPASVAPSRLKGGIDIAASLRAGMRVEETGLLGRADGGFAVLAMAERTERGVAAIFAQALDISRENGSGGFCLIALDEAEKGDMPMSSALVDRLDIALNLNGIAMRETCMADDEAVTRPAISPGAVEFPDELLSALGEAILTIPGTSMRKYQAVTRLARMVAAIDDRSLVTPPDRAAAIRLCLGAFASGEAASEDEQEDVHQEEQQPPNVENGESDPGEQQSADDPGEPDQDHDIVRDGEVPEEMMIARRGCVEAVSALLARADTGRATNLARTGKSGAMRSGSRRADRLALSIVRHTRKRAQTWLPHCGQQFHGKDCATPRQAETGRREPRCAYCQRIFAICGFAIALSRPRSLRWMRQAPPRFHGYPRPRVQSSCYWAIVMFAGTMWHWLPFAALPQRRCLNPPVPWCAPSAASRACPAAVPLRLPEASCEALSSPIWCAGADNRP
ncbi:MAG: hypothetical protein R3D29_08845 [Nitratireductor sp.]